MNTWIIVAVYVANDVTFYQLRLCIESILREVPRGDYAKLLVVDDHSPYNYSTFRDCYRDDERIEFLIKGAPRPSYYGLAGAPCGPDVTSTGHGESLHSGTLHAKERGATHVWTLDSDTLILDGSGLRKALGVIGRDNRIRSVGDYAWGKPGVRNGTCFSSHRLTTTGVRQNKLDVKEGKTNAICGLWDVGNYNYPYNSTVDWGSGDVGHPFVARFCNMGQAGTRVVEGIWSLGLATAYFPFFWGSCVAHFGYGTVVFTRDQIESHGMGNAPDVGVRYGNKNQGDYYAGFLQLQCSTAEFHNHLRALYQGRPFDDVSARFARNLLAPPDPIRAP